MLCSGPAHDRLKQSKRKTDKNSKYIQILWIRHISICLWLRRDQEGRPFRDNASFLVALTKETTVREATSVVSVVSEHKANTVSRRNDIMSQKNTKDLSAWASHLSRDRVVQSGMKSGVVHLNRHILSLIEAHFVGDSKRESKPSFAQVLKSKVRAPKSIRRWRAGRLRVIFSFLGLFAVFGVFGVFCVRIFFWLLYKNLFESFLHLQAHKQPQLVLSIGIFLIFSNRNYLDTMHKRKLINLQRFGPGSVLVLSWYERFPINWQTYCLVMPSSSVSSTRSNNWKLQSLCFDCS